MKGTRNQQQQAHHQTSPDKEATLGVNIIFVSDLELGHVLLFPINDKQSRLDGHDQVSFVEVKLRLLLGKPTLVLQCHFLAVAVLWVCVG